jgi:hypothetical protein
MHLKSFIYIYFKGKAKVLNTAIAFFVDKKPIKGA